MAEQGPATDRQPVRTWLIGGFLGAGKTTFILEHLRHAPGKVAVLVNEFGKLGLDGDLIRLEGGLEVVELPGGCICCSQKEGLRERVRDIARRLAPDLLLIEPSGVAETSELMQALEDPAREGVIRIELAITLLDAETFLEYAEPDAFGLFFLDQVSCADLILINKSDLVSPDLLRRIEERVDAIHPGVPVFRTEHGRLPAVLPEPGSSRGAGAPVSSRGFRVEAASCVPAPITREGLAQFLGEVRIGAFGKVLRGKGVLAVSELGPMNLQIVGPKVNLTPVTGELAPRLTLLGFGLNHDRIHRFFEERGGV
ncbi:CobW family GTP-binding protein [Geomesophilobacter sediminis]|uniref:GTP-binding protein n=1 Tax=Geomesophilobacter sediminis TaxID=2798584 RepID=A0A8J7JGW5_9BACT|nr:CobW family GTP-binding protein [Geomesophilobacter sediminis]MBJ6726234.1 GTP-binding protein [Geomesophilobacter sediminis]